MNLEENSFQRTTQAYSCPYRERATEKLIRELATPQGEAILREQVKYCNTTVKRDNVMGTRGRYIVGANTPLIYGRMLIPRLYMGGCISLLICGRTKQRLRELDWRMHQLFCLCVYKCRYTTSVAYRPISTVRGRKHARRKCWRCFCPTSRTRHQPCTGIAASASPAHDPMIASPIHYRCVSRDVFLDLTTKAGLALQEGLLGTPHHATQPLTHSLTQPTNQPINQSINQPTNQPTNQPPTHPTNQPTNQSTNQPIN